MRLSVVFELFLVFLFLAFAAARVIDPKSATKNVIQGTKKQTVVRQGPPNRYCACTSKMCNCCRDFSLPVVPLKGPGCASLLYVQKNTMLVTMSFGDRVLSNTTISGKNPQPICMPLPGGISQFCGRVYGISRKGDQFRACLGLELRALDDIEAALRISCFKFGPKGVNLEAAPPVPTGTNNNKKPEDDDDDDDDDDYLDDDDDDEIIGFGVDDDEGSSEDNEVDSDSVDYTGFSVLGEDILGSLFSDDSGSSGVKKKKVKKTAKPQVILQKAPTTTTTTTTRRPFLQTRWRPAIPSFVTRRPLIRRPTTATVTDSSKPSTVALTTESEFSATMSPALVTSTLINNKDNNVAHEHPTIPTKTIFITNEPSIPQSVEKLNRITVFEDTDSMKTETETVTPVTFTVPTKRIEPMKNDIKIPNVDLSKIEALAAIAQQDVTTGVFSTSSLTLDETEKNSEEMVTTKYEKIVPTFISHQANKNSHSTEKINYVQFVPNVIVTPTSNIKLPAESILIQRNVTNTHPTNLVTIVPSSKTKVTNNVKATTIKPNLEKEKDEEEDDDDDDDDDDNDEENEDTSYDVEEESSNENRKEEQDKEQIIKNNKKPITVSKVTYKTKNKNKGSFKKQPNKVSNKESEEEEEEEEDDDDDDILSGVLGDDDGEEENEEENEEEEEEEKEKEEDNTEKNTEVSTTTKRPKTGSEKEKEENESDEEESEEEPEDDDLDDDEIAEILGETKINTNKKKPVAVTVNKKPLSDNKEKVSENDDDEDDEDEDDDDVLAALSDDDTEDEDDEKTEKNKNKTKTKKPVKSSTVKVKIASQSVTQNLLTGQSTTQKTVNTSSNKQSNTQKIIQTSKIKKKPSAQTQQLAQSAVRNPIQQQIIQSFQRIPANPQKIDTTEIRNSTNYITQILQTEPGEIQNNFQNVIWKTPIPQDIIQKLITRKPVDITEKTEEVTNAAQTVSEKLEMPGETTEKVFTYEPITQKVFLYSRPENQVPQKMSGVTFYQKPITQQYVIYNEPIEKTTEVPVTFIYPPQESITKVEGTKLKDKETENDDTSHSHSHSHSSESSSEEHAEEHNVDKPTFTASIDPGFSNKYGEEHDLAENEDLEIEDSDDDDEDGEDVDDRKIKQISKTAVVKSASSKKPAGVFSDPKWVRLSSAGSQPKKFFNLIKDNKPISTSRTHRRMNLDRFLGN